MKKILLLALLFAGIFSCTSEVQDLPNEVPTEEVSFNVVGMYCDGCVKAIGDRMKKIDGATDVRVTLKDSLVVFKIPGDKIPSDTELSAMLEELGYSLVTDTE
jgi:copper chaperone CopZ